MPTDLLIYIVIAAVLVFWLRNTLGTRTGEERELPNPLESAQPENRGKVVDITDSGDHAEALQAAYLKGLDFQDNEARDGMLELMRTDPGFDPHRFIDGAREAFPMIVESFAKGDLRILRELLAPAVYTTFEQAIEDRQTRGEIVATEIHAVRKAQIIDVRQIARTAYIKMRFVADETCVIRDREGTIMSGNPDRVTEMNDVWTFGRDLRSKDPTWLLYETSDDVPEHEKTPVPDARQD